MRIGLIGPLPPPSGGMANQTLQLHDLLKGEGLSVELVQTNQAYKPAWVASMPVLRAGFRLIAYMVHLWKLAGRSDVIHIMANSGWSWHLFASPAVWIAKCRHVPTIVNYRGGKAEKFLQKSVRIVKPTLNATTRIVVPSRFLSAVFNKFDVETSIIANIIDTSRFNNHQLNSNNGYGPHILVARNLEEIYDNAMAIQAFGRILEQYPNATLTIAGTGPEKNNLVDLAEKLGLTDKVTFTGRVDREQMPDLYRSANIMLNPSQVDNMPNSILEALASSIPVVSTNVGGIPYMVDHEKNVLLVNSRDDQAMADEVCRVLSDDQLRSRLINAGLELVKTCSWPVVRDQWLNTYKELAENESA